MLVLTRKVGERVIIDEKTVITITDIRGDNVRLSFDAPREVKIYRGEIHEAIAAENAQAAKPAPAADFDWLKKIPKSE